MAIQPINYGAMAMQPLMAGFQNALEMARLGQQGRQFGQQQELAQQRMAQQDEQFAAQQAAAAQRQAQQQSQFEQEMQLQRDQLAQRQKQFDLQQERAQRSKDELAAKREEAARLFKSGTPDQIAEFTLRNPEIGNELERRIGYKSDTTKKIMADTLSQALSVKDQAQRDKIINDGAEKIKSAGGDPKNLLASVGGDPEEFERGAILALGSTGEYGKGYLNAYSKVSGKPKTENEKEIDALKKREQEAKTAQAEEKVATKIREKEKDYNNALIGAQATLYSVSELLNHPGLDKAVGIKSLAPTIPGSDSANFETLLESFVGNLTMENMGVMKGVLSDSDIKMIRSASSGLDVKMSPEAFKKRLIAIRDRLNEKVKGKQLMGQQEESQPSPTATPEQKPSKTVNWADL